MSSKSGSFGMLSDRRALDGRPGNEGSTETTGTKAADRSRDFVATGCRAKTCAAGRSVRWSQQRFLPLPLACPGPPRGSRSVVRERLQVAVVDQDERLPRERRAVGGDAVQQAARL